MNKLKVMSEKAKPEGSIAEGYVAEEALTFSSHYFRDVTTKFNHPDHNVDPPPPTHDGRRTTQNSGICSPGGKDGEMYYGQLQEILEFLYLLFRVKWFDTRNDGPHWVINPETGTYDVESIRERRPESITPTDWDAQIAFWNDPRNQARAAQNRQNRGKSKVVCRQGSRSLARLRDQMMDSSATREYPSLIHTFFVTHTVNGVFTRDEDQALYEEMLRLQALGSNIETGVPYTEEEIMAIVRKGKQRGHLPGVGRVLSGRATDGCPPLPQSTVDLADVEKLKKSNKSLTKQVKMMMRLFRSDDKFLQMLDQFESSSEFGGASGSDGCGDDEPGGDEDDDEDDNN
ncbi:beta-xylosidase/alpha-L-arabinofuranosidase 2 [Tanacetum coccineum]